ncbi:MAG: dihydrofolate reductase, partial [Alphaproteobacteria bacterium]
AIIANSIDTALALARAEAAKLRANEIHMIGGAEIFRQTLPLARRIYLTDVHGSPEGDVKLEAFDPKDWREVSRERHEKDARHEYAFDFVTLERC